jgi:hypothetical protein
MKNLRLSLLLTLCAAPALMATNLFSITPVVTRVTVGTPSKSTYLSAATAGARHRTRRQLRNLRSLCVSDGCGIRFIGVSRNGGERVDASSGLRGLHRIPTSRGSSTTLEAASASPPIRSSDRITGPIPRMAVCCSQSIFRRSRYRRGRPYRSRTSACKIITTMFPMGPASCLIA